MVKIKLILAILFLSIITSCVSLGMSRIFEKGYVNENEQYVPKRPKFKFKDKDGNIVPVQLDTTNVYRLYNIFFQGETIYPFNEDSTDNNNAVFYIKFYPNGRCLRFSIPFTEPGISLKETDLNPDNSYYSKDYYFSEDGDKIQIESFVYGNGYGEYVIFDYCLNEYGDTLTMIANSGNRYNTTKRIYIKEGLPSHWKKYKIDW